MKNLDTVALFTPNLQQSYDLRDKHAEEVAVGRLLRIFAKAGLIIRWVHIVHRNIRAQVGWRSSVRQTGITYRAVRSDGTGHQGLRAQKVDQLPEEVFETRWKLGADFVMSYSDYEKGQLHELHVTELELMDHTRTRMERREKEENLARKRESDRQYGVHQRQKEMARKAGHSNGVASSRGKPSHSKRRKRK